MSHTCLIRFAPLITLTVMHKFGDGSLNLNRQYYSRGSLKPLPGMTEIPLVIDHDPDRQVGVVRSFMEFEDVHDDWVLAVCDVTDPPSWLKRDTPASFEYRALRRSEFRGFRRVDQGLVSEVSILSPGVRPKEPAAKVLTLRPSNTAGEVIRGGRFIHRYFESPITVR